MLLRTRCGAYAVRPDGTVQPAAPAPSRYLGAFARLSKRHVVVVDHGRVVWRSRRAFRTKVGPEAAAVGARHVAFSFYRGRLWVARLGGPERPVARGEVPLGWTRNEDLLAVHWEPRSTTIFVHRGGRKVTIGRDVGTLAFDDSTATVLFVSRDRLVRSDGRLSTQLASLSRLGVSGLDWLQLVGDGLIVLQGSDRLVVLRPDGSVFASSLFAGLAREQGRVAFDSAPAFGSGQVAFTVREPKDSTSFAEDVFVLREGSSQAIRLLTRDVDYSGCGWYTALAWQGDWLLYEAPAVTTVVALDTTGLDATVDLTPLVRSLPGVSVDQTGEGLGFVDASWQAAGS